MILPFPRFSFLDMRSFASVLSSVFLPCYSVVSGLALIFISA